MLTGWFWFPFSARSEGTMISGMLPEPNRLSSEKKNKYVDNVTVDLPHRNPRMWRAANDIHGFSSPRCHLCHQHFEAYTLCHETEPFQVQLPPWHSFRRYRKPDSEITFLTAWPCLLTIDIKIQDQPPISRPGRIFKHGTGHERDIPGCC